MIRLSQWNFEQLRNIIDCASYAQDSGKDDVANNVLESLANDIYDHLNQLTTNEE